MAFTALPVVQAVQGLVKRALIHGRLGGGWERGTEAALLVRCHAVKWITTTTYRALSERNEVGPPAKQEWGQVAGGWAPPVVEHAGALPAAEALGPVDPRSAAGAVVHRALEAGGALDAPAARCRLRIAAQQQPSGRGGQLLLCHLVTGTCAPAVALQVGCSCRPAACVVKVNQVCRGCMIRCNPTASATPPQHEPSNAQCNTMTCVKTATRLASR
jgi:hypothetical protein